MEATAAATDEGDGEKNMEGVKDEWFPEVDIGGDCCNWDCDDCEGEAVVDHQG